MPRTKYIPPDASRYSTHNSHIPLQRASFASKAISLSCIDYSDILIYKMQQTEDTPPSSASPDVETQTSEAQESDYAFLVHSQDTLSQEVGPETTTQRLARQKRRRTRYESYVTYLHTSVRTEIVVCSPEDHAILEAEYERNPKPDKAARIKIVGRVALGEKEVQVSRINSHGSLACQFGICRVPLHSTGIMTD